MILCVNGPASLGGERCLVNKMEQCNIVTCYLVTRQ
jgi:hypothetical protein